MHTKAVKYNGIYIDPNSTAYRLHKEGKLQQLKEHVASILKRDNIQHEPVQHTIRPLCR